MWLIFVSAFDYYKDCHLRLGFCCIFLKYEKEAMRNIEIQKVRILKYKIMGIGVFNVFFD